MSSPRRLTKEQRKKILENLSAEELDMVLNMLAKYIVSAEEREKRLKEMFKI